MLVLTRKAGEAIHIGGDVFVRVIQTTAGRVRLGIVAPSEVPVTRGEILDSTVEKSQAEPAIYSVNDQGAADQSFYSTTARRSPK